LFIPNFGSLIFCIKFKSPFIVHITDLPQSPLARAVGGDWDIELISTHDYYYVTMFLSGSLCHCERSVVFLYLDDNSIDFAVKVNYSSYSI
jgi:hypothetical protein